MVLQTVRLGYRTPCTLGFQPLCVELPGLALRYKYSQDTDMETSSSAAKTRRLRWDIRIGLFASALAIAGLVSSILRGNEDVLGSQFVATGLQKTLLVFAIVLACMTVAKWCHAKRNGNL